MHETDAMTDEARKEVVTRNGAGHSLSFYRVGRAIWMNFRLAGSSSDVLGNPAPMYRVDKNKPVDLEGMRRLQQDIDRTLPTLYAQEPKWFNERVWHGDGLPGEGLRRFLSGQTVVIRCYHLFTGGYKDTSFSLVGLGAAMKTAFDIDADVDPAAIEDDRALRVAFSERLKACHADHGGTPQLQTCRERALACVKASQSAAAFEMCLGEQ